MRRGAVVTVLLALLVAPVVSAGAGDPASDLDRVRGQIEALSASIDQSRAESRRVAGQLAAAQERLAAVQAELAAAQAEVDRVSSEIATEEAAHEALAARLAALQEELAATRVRTRQALDDLESQAVALYMNASASTSVFMLDFESVGDVAVGLVYAGDLADDSEDLLSSYTFLVREEERQQALVSDQKAQVQTALDRLAVEKADLQHEAARVETLRAEAERDLAESQTLLSGIQADISAAEQHQEGLEADAERLEKELAARQSTAGENPGILAWPVAGRVSSPFGYRVHPILGTRRLHTGIDISAGYGTPIAAAGSGVVILAGPYGGYGNAVVIDHGGGLATLYAHQSKIAVGNGDHVDTGDIIGYVGCTGLCTGAHLHFETREHGRPVDPMRYLRG